MIKLEHIGRSESVISESRASQERTVSYCKLRGVLDFTLFGDVTALWYKISKTGSVEQSPGDRH